jgi:hypothetical protein
MGDRGARGWSLDRTQATLGEITVTLFGALVVYLLRGHLAEGLIGGIVICLVGIGLIEVVRRRRLTSRKTKPPSAESPDLEVTIESEQFHWFKYKALIAEIKVGVRNNSDRQKDLTGLALTTSGPWGGILHLDPEVEEEVRKLKTPHARIAGKVDPGGTVVGWVVHAFPYRPEGGEPGYQIFVTDELGHEYGCERQAKPKRTFQR